MCLAGIEFSLSAFGFLWKGKLPLLPSFISVEFGFFAPIGDEQRGGVWSLCGFLTDHQHPSSLLSSCSS